MNSLQDLNGFSTQSISFNDYRDESIKFSAIDTEYQSKSIYQYQQFSLDPAVDILKIVNLTQDIVYKITLPGNISANVQWPTISANLVANSITSGGYTTFSVYKIKTIDDWFSIRTPLITTDTANNYVITSNIAGANVSKTWITSVAGKLINEMSAPNDFYYTQDNSYYPLLSSAPVVYPHYDYPTYLTDSYTLTVTPSNVSAVGNIVSSGIGTSSSNNVSKVLTITGNVAKINSHLANIAIWSTASSIKDWNLTYSLTNPAIPYTSVQTQSMHDDVVSIATFGNISYYKVNTLTSISSEPQIVDTREDRYYYHYWDGLPWYVNSGNVALPGWNPDDFNASYFVRVKPTSATYVANISANIYGVGNVSNHYSQISSTEFTVWGTKSQINNVLSNIQVQGTSTYAGEIDLQYVITAPYGNINAFVDPNNATYYNHAYTATPAGNTVTRVQTLYGDSSDYVSNMGMTRTFQQNSPSTLFSYSVPSISSPGTGNYTITLTTSAGQFGLSDTSTTSSYSYTGTASQVNSIFSSLKFYPYLNVTGSQSFTYSQYYNGSAQVVNQTVGLMGYGDGTLPAYNSTVLTSTGTWKPTFQQKMYYNYVDIATVGGGGGGSYREEAFGIVYPGPGGGGGGVVQAINVPVSELSIYYSGSSIPITIGSGGAAGGGPYNADPATGGNTVIGTSTNYLKSTGGTGARAYDYFASPLAHGLGGTGYAYPTTYTTVSTGGSGAVSYVNNHTSQPGRTADDGVSTFYSNIKVGSGGGVVTGSSYNVTYQLSPGETWYSYGSGGDGCSADAQSVYWATSGFSGAVIIQFHN